MKDRLVLAAAVALVWGPLGGCLLSVALPLVPLGPCGGSSPSAGLFAVSSLIGFMGAFGLVALAGAREDRRQSRS